MSHLFEDYREIKNVRDKLDFIVEQVRSAPRRVFLTQQGKVKAVVLSPVDYEDLWNLELDRDMKLCAQEKETYSTEEVIAHLEHGMTQPRAEYDPDGPHSGWPAFIAD